MEREAAKDGLGKSQRTLMVKVFMKDIDHHKQRVPHQDSEYGSCYCNLYVSRAWNEDKIPHLYVPERRPPEKML